MLRCAPASSEGHAVGLRCSQGAQATASTLQRQPSPALCFFLKKLLPASGILDLDTQTPQPLGWMDGWMNEVCHSGSCLV